MRRSFTVIELMISLSIAAILFLLMYRVIDIERKGESFIKQKSEFSQRENSLIRTVFRDIAEGSAIIIAKKDEKKDILAVRTENSFHKIPNPFVYYFPVGKNGTLCRVESSVALSAGEIERCEEKESYFADVIAENVSFFKISTPLSSQYGKLLLYLSFENGRKILFAVPTYAITVTHNKNSVN